jgi:uncharacterized protein YigE (DUF2233 family)
MHNTWRARLTLLTLAAAMAACGPGTPPPATLTPEPSRTPEPTLGPQIFPTFVPEVPVVIDGAPQAATPVPAVTYDNQWRVVKPGLDVILLRGRVGRRDELLVVVRVDPVQLPVRVRYDNEQPKLVREWFDAEKADVAINANFFLEDKRTAGMLISNGQIHGTSYSGFGGMFSLRGTQPTLQWLRTTPYQPDASIDHAVQGVPMLVLNGRVVQGINDNGERNRRSFVAIDRNGLILLGVSQTASWSLIDLATFLAGARVLDVREACNLDGGASSGMWVRSSIDPVLTNSIDTVPSVIVVGGA